MVVREKTAETRREGGGGEGWGRGWGGGGVRKRRTKGNSTWDEER